MAQQPEQHIRLGSLVKKVGLEDIDGKLFIMLQDVQDIFKGARYLELNGTSVPFVRGPDFKRVEPLRIRHQEGCIFDVILESSEDQRPVASAPIAIPSPQSTAPTTPSSSLTNSFVSPLSSPVSVPPLSIVRSPMPTLYVVQEEEVEDPAGVNRSGHGDQTPPDSTLSSSSLPSTEQDPDTHTNLSSPPLLEEDRLQEDHTRRRNLSLDTSVSSAAPLARAPPTVHTSPIDFPEGSKEEWDRVGPKASIEHHDSQTQPVVYKPAYIPLTNYESRRLNLAPDQVGPHTLEILTHRLHTQQGSSQSHHPTHQQPEQQQQFPSGFHGPISPWPQQDIINFSPPALRCQSPPLSLHQQQLQHQQLQQQRLQQQLWQQPDLQEQQRRKQQQQQWESTHQQQRWSNEQQPNTTHLLAAGRPDIVNTMITAPIPIPKAAPGLTRPTPVPVDQHYESTIGGPQVLDREHQALYGLSPPINHLSRPQYIHGSLSELRRQSTRLDSEGVELDAPSGHSLNENRVNDLEKQLKQQKDWTEIATQVQNKVQSVLTQNHSLHEHPIPRLFLVLPSVDIDSKQDAQNTTALNRRTSTVSTSSTIPPPSPTRNDQKQFRVYFLCECGQHTSPLKYSGLNHIHYVGHEGYELIRPQEFFEKYGAFIRSLSHLIRKGVNCGTVSIPPLLSNAAQGQSHLHSQDPNSNYRTYAVGHELLKNSKLDARLAETIEYLDSRKKDSDLDSLDATLRSGVEFLDGTDIRQLLTYIRMPPQDISSIGGLYRIVTSRGFAKWICEDHYRSTIHQQNEVVFQQEIGVLGGQYDVKTGRAKIRLASAQDATQLYKIMVKAYNLHELDISLKWAFNESDIQRLTQAVSESRIIILSLDGCREKSESSSNSGSLINFGKKYDPLYRVLFSSKIQSLRLANIPSLLPKISSNHQLAASSTFSVRILQLENVGTLDFSVSEKNPIKSIKSSNSQSHSRSIMRTLLTSFHSLTSIIVPGMNIRDDGVQLLVEQANLHKTLRRINLSDNGISSVGGRALAACLNRERAIIHLDLGSNALGDEALASILEAMGPKLLLLNLESTGFGDKAMKVLERLVLAFYSGPDTEPRLEFLNLANNGWTTTGIKSLGRTLAHLRLFTPTATSSNRKPEQPGHLEMSAGEAFLLVNSMIKTTQLPGVSDKPWHQNPAALVAHCALTATRESYEPPMLPAQDIISINSRLKVLRLSDAGLSEGAAQYISGLLDLNVLTKLDLRRCIRLFKPQEMLMMLSRLLMHSGHRLSDNTQMLFGTTPGRKNVPQAPTPYGVAGSPRSSLRFLHLNSTGVDDQAAWVLAQDLQSGGSCIERLDIGGNHLTHQGIAMILNALCNNTSVQHLNLNQNFNAHSIYPSSATASAQMTREALRRFFLMNKTLQVLYFICADIDVVAQGLSSNNTIRSLVFDRLEGSFRDVEAFGKALAVNQTLLRFKVADGRQAHFSQTRYGQPNGQHVQYVDPFREFKQDAIRTVEKGLSFNYTIIEFHWPEMFEASQAWIERVNSILARNIEQFKSQGGSDVLGHSRDGSGSHRQSKGKTLTRGVSVLSTTSTLSNGSSSSSNSSLSMDLGFGTSSAQVYAGNGSSNNISNAFVPVSSPKGPGDGYSYSVYSNGSSGSDPWAVSNSLTGGGSRGEDTRLSYLELSASTLNQIRSPPSGVRLPITQTPPGTTRVDKEPHINHRFQPKKR